MSEDWFSSPDWDSDAQVEFRRRLSRARNQKPYYLRMKAAAIAEAFPEAALALCDQRIVEGDDDEGFGASYAKALILARVGRIDDMLTALEASIGPDGLALGAPAAGEYCCLVGFYGRTDLYPRAVRILDALDDEAYRQLGRPFRSFLTRAARALITYQTGNKRAAAAPAKEALALALDQSTAIMGMSGLGPAPGFPSSLNDALVVIAGFWDEAELGPPPKVG